MKLGTTFFFLILTITVAAQGNFADAPDSLAVVELDYELMDSNEVKAMNPVFSKRFRNIATYLLPDGMHLAYYPKNRNNWISVELPFTEHPSSCYWLNLDQKGRPELVVKGEMLAYGSGGGTGTKGVMILSIDSIPKQIFKVYNGCFEDNFGDKTQDSKGVPLRKYERRIRISGQNIIIAPLDKNRFTHEDCEMTEIAAGTYIMEGGQIKRRKPGK